MFFFILNNRRLLDLLKLSIFRHRIFFNFFIFKTIEAFATLNFEIFCQVHTTIIHND